MQTTACLIIIGNEILSGRTQDKHLAWLAKELNEAGVSLAEARVISDDESIIINTVNACRKGFTYVFTTGGIGPTHDDITAAAVAKAFGIPFGLNADAMAILEKHYGKTDFNEARRRMAMTPQGVTLIPNPVSAAPGFQIENVYVMAGVPSVMQAMFAHIKPSLNGGAKMLSKIISAYVTEGVIAQKLATIQDAHPGVAIGSYPFIRNQKLGTSLVARCTDAAKLDAAYAEIKSLLLSLTDEVVEDDLAA